MKNVTTIEQLKLALQQVWNKEGFGAFTPIQSTTLPMILEGKDVIAHSPTGTGKTIAYLLPIMEKIDPSSDQVQTVILAPSRELVMQIFQEIKKWSEGQSIRTASFVGGANIKRQLDKLKERPQIVVGSPGRILELIKLKKLKMHAVQTVVLDEGDQLLGREHLDTVRTIVKSTLNDRQLLLFSATELKEPEQIKAMIGRDPEWVNISRATDNTQGKVQHYYLLCEQRERMKLLKKIAAMPNVKALVFLRDVGNMNVLLEKLLFEQVPVAGIHSEMSKHEREKALTAFRTNKVPLLLATDVAARGLDIEGVTHVLHYDLTREADQYIHRSGRTGRMGRDGIVVSFVNPREERDVKRLSKQLDIPIQKRRIYKGNFVESK